MKKKEISLLSEKPLQTTAWGRFVSWLTSSGRAVLVFVELAVLLAFISRFWLDTKNNDLGEVIREKKVILESSLQFEKEFLQLQNRMNLAAGYTASRPFGLGKAVEIIARNLPAEIVLVNFNFFNKNNLKEADFTLNVFSEESLAIFIDRLAGDKQVASVRVGKIEEGKFGKGTEMKLMVLFADLSKQ